MKKTISYFLFSILIAIIAPASGEAAAFSPQIKKAETLKSNSPQSRFPKVSTALSGANVDKAEEVDADRDGFTARADCDDGNPDIHPDRKDCRGTVPVSLRSVSGSGRLAANSTDRGTTGVDDDCDGDIDEDWICLSLLTRGSHSSNQQNESATETDSDALPNINENTVEQAAEETATDLEETAPEIIAGEIAPESQTDEDTDGIGAPDFSDDESDLAPSYDTARRFPTVEGATLTQVPFFQMSSLSSAITPLSDNRGFVQLSETGASVHFENTGWARVVLSYYEGTNEYGYGSIVADPAAPETMYGCFGVNNTSTSTVDEYGWSILGNVVRFDTSEVKDDVIRADRIAGNASYSDSLVFNCNPGTEFGRADVEPETGLSIWYIIGHAPRFAFVPYGAEGFSKKFYFLSRLYGPLLATLNTDGSAVESVEFLDPELDPAASGTVEGVSIYWASAPNKVGSVILADPVHLKAATERGSTREMALYVGYYDNSIVTGGLRRILIGEDGAIADDLWIDHPVTGLPLDVRDVACLENQSVTLDIGTTLALHCMVAAGRDGVFLLRNEPDGSVTLTEVSGTASIVSNLVTADDGSILSRRQYVDLCSATSGGCTDVISYFAVDVDVQEVDGTTYAVLTQSRQAYIAALDDPESPHWIPLPLTPASGSALVNGDIVTGKPGKIALADALNGSATEWTPIEGYADRTGFALSIDPRDSSRIVGTSLDGTAMLLEYDENYEARSLVFPGADTELRSSDFGMCYGLIEQTDTSMLVAGEHMSIDGATRYNSYGMSVLWAKKNGEWFGFIGANHFDGNDGNIHKLTYDESSGKYTATPVIGVRDCVNVYPDWNHSETTCVHVCEPNPEGRELPNGTTSLLMITKENADNMAVVKYRDGEYSLWRSTDGGENWDDISTSYVYAPTGASLGLLGSPSDVMAHPTDENVFYLAYGTYGVYKLDLSLGSATFISPVVANGDPLDPRMPRYRGATFSVLGETIYQTPYIYDIEVVLDSAGIANIHTATYVFTDGYLGKWPESQGQSANGGGDYLIIDDGTNQPGVKLNFVGDSLNPIQNFAPSHVAVSSDGQTIVLVGANPFNWDCQGNAPAIMSGAIFSRDGGATWSNLFPDGYAPKVWSIGADPNDPDKFVIGMSGDGTWELKFE